MQKNEFKVISGADADSFEKALNAAAAEGYDLAQYSNSGGSWSGIVKRATTENITLPAQAKMPVFEPGSSDETLFPEPSPSAATSSAGPEWRAYEAPGS